MVLVTLHPDGTSTVYGFNHRSGAEFSTCELPIHPTLVARCEDPDMHTYAYDGENTIYNHHTLRKIECPSNVTHITRMGMKCLMLTRSHELYYSIGPQCMYEDAISTRVDCDVEFKAIGDCIGLAYSVAVSVDNRIYHIRYHNGTIIATPTNQTCEGIGPLCNVAAVISNIGTFSVVWDDTTVCYDSGDNTHRYTFEDGVIKTCAQQSSRHPLVLMTDGRLLNMELGGQLHVAYDVVSLANGCHGSGHVTYIVTRDGRVGRLDDSKKHCRGLINGMTATMGNCPPLPRRVRTIKSAMSTEQQD